MNDYEFFGNVSDALMPQLKEIEDKGKTEVELYDALQSYTKKHIYESKANEVISQDMKDLLDKMYNSEYQSYGFDSKKITDEEHELLRDMILLGLVSADPQGIIPSRSNKYGKGTSVKLTPQGLDLARRSNAISDVDMGTPIYGESSADEVISYDLIRYLEDIKNMRKIDAPRMDEHEYLEQQALLLGLVEQVGDSVKLTPEGLTEINNQYLKAPKRVGYDYSDGSPSIDFDKWTKDPETQTKHYMGEAVSRDLYEFLERVNDGGINLSDINLDNAFGRITKPQNNLDYKADNEYKQFKNAVMLGLVQPYEYSRGGNIRPTLTTLGVDTLKRYGLKYKEGTNYNADDFMGIPLYNESKATEGLSSTSDWWKSLSKNEREEALKKVYITKDNVVASVDWNLQYLGDFEYLSWNTKGRLETYHDEVIQPKTKEEREREENEELSSSDWWDRHGGSVIDKLTESKATEVNYDYNEIKGGGTWVEYHGYDGRTGKPDGSVKKGKAWLKGPAGWVVGDGSSHADFVDESNFISSESKANEEWNQITSDGSVGKSRFSGMHSDDLHGDLEDWITGWHWSCDYCSGIALGNSFGAEQIHIIEAHLRDEHNIQVVHESKASEIFGQNDPDEILGGSFGTPENTMNDVYNMGSHNYSDADWDKYEKLILNVKVKNERDFRGFTHESIDSFLRRNGATSEDLIYDLTMEYGTSGGQAIESKASEKMWECGDCDGTGKDEFGMGCYNCKGTGQLSEEDMERQYQIDQKWRNMAFQDDDYIDGSDVPTSGFYESIATEVDNSMDLGLLSGDTVVDTGLGLYDEQCPICGKDIDNNFMDYHMEQDHGVHSPSQYTQDTISQSMGDPNYDHLEDWRTSYGESKKIANEGSFNDAMDMLMWVNYDSDEEMYEAVAEYTGMDYEKVKKRMEVEQMALDKEEAEFQSKSNEYERIRYDDYGNPINDDDEEESNWRDLGIEAGDYVDFGSYGKLYVTQVNWSGMGSADKMWATDLEEERYNRNAEGWNVNSSDAVSIISKGTQQMYRESKASEYDAMKDVSFKEGGHYGQAGYCPICDWKTTEEDWLTDIEIHLSEGHGIRDNDDRDVILRRAFESKANELDRWDEEEKEMDKNPLEQIPTKDYRYEDGYDLGTIRAINALRDTEEEKPEDEPHEIGSFDWQEGGESEGKDEPEYYDDIPEEKLPTDFELEDVKEEDVVVENEDSFPPQEEEWDYDQQTMNQTDVEQGRGDKGTSKAEEAFNKGASAEQIYSLVDTKESEDDRTQSEDDYLTNLYNKTTANKSAGFIDI